MPRMLWLQSSAVGQPVDPSPSASLLSWFWGPVVTLQDCLAAFFARDELKGEQVGGANLFQQRERSDCCLNNCVFALFLGDNMYSCEKCKK